MDPNIMMAQAIMTTMITSIEVSLLLDRSALLPAAAATTVPELVGLLVRL